MKFKGTAECDEDGARVFGDSSILGCVSQGGRKKPLRPASRGTLTASLKLQSEREMPPTGFIAMFPPIAAEDFPKSHFIEDFHRFSEPWLCPSKPK
jgi:hypothetical protein